MHVHCEHPLWAYTSRCDNTTVRVVQPREQVHRGRIVLVINSFEGSRAVERAVAHGFGSEDTLVVSGGASAESLVRTEHCIHYKVVHNSIDFTGLITVVERLPNIVRAMGTFDAFFYSTTLWSLARPFARGSCRSICNHRSACCHRSR